MRLAIIGAMPLLRRGLVLLLRSRGLVVHAEHRSLAELAIEPVPDALVLVSTGRDRTAASTVPRLALAMARGTDVLVLTDAPHDWSVTAGGLRSAVGHAGGPGLGRRLDVLDLGAASDPSDVVAWLAARRSSPVAAHGTSHAPARDALTGSEREVYQLLAQGLSNAGIAEALSLSRRTVECHVSHLFAKLGLACADPGSNPRVAAALRWSGGG